MSFQRTVRVRKISRCQLTYNTVSTVDVEPGEVVDDVNGVIIDVPSTLTASLASSGANGLDTGSEAATTWYSVWVIFGTSGVASLLSISSTAPTLPAGFDAAKRRVGWVYNDGSSNLRDFIVQVRGASRLYSWWNTERDTNNVVQDGTSTTYVTVDCSDWAPPTCRVVSCQIYMLLDSNTSPARTNFTRNGVVEATPISDALALSNNTGSADTGATDTYVPIDANQQGQYSVSNSQGDATVRMLGFIDQLEID